MFLKSDFSKAELAEWTKAVQGFPGDDVPLILLSSLMGKVFEWDKWCSEIPPLPFKEGWVVKVVPPRVGAVVRFWVTTPDILRKSTNGGHGVSVYLDCYDALGIVGQPYWETYDGDETERVLMQDVNGLIDAIEKGLKKLEVGNG